MRRFHVCKRPGTQSPARSLAAGISSTPRGRPSGVSPRSIADTLRGKGKPEYTPHVDTGDFVVVVNAEKIQVTGNKLDQKMYYRHSGYPGGLRSRHAARAARAPADRGAPQGGEGHAPAEPLGRAQIGKLKIYAGPEHPHAAQAPEPLDAGDEVSELATYRGTGKRKTSVARVILRPGDGTTWFNGRTLEDYFPRLSHRYQVLAPLRVAGLEGTYDIRVRVHGGGASGQAGAIRHGIARALVEADPELRTVLKREGFLARDSRIVERKKAGLHKARKAPQFSQALARLHGTPVLRHRRCAGGSSART